MCGKAVYAHSGRQPVEGARAELLATAADASSYVFSASALQTDAPAVHADNETGAILVLDALENANTVEVVEGVGIRDRRDGYVFGTSDEPDAAELHERHMALLDAMGLRAKSYGDDALRAWRCLAVAILLKDARASLYSDQCERVLEDIDTAFRCRLELAAQPPASFCNPDDYLSLCLMLGSPHTSVMRREAVRSRNVARSMRSKYASVKESGSYRLGNAIVRAGRKFIPRSVIAHMKG